MVNDSGVQHLVTALQQNRVRLRFCSFMFGLKPKMKVILKCAGRRVQSENGCF
jgi:hypothetical protein